MIGVLDFEERACPDRLKRDFRFQIQCLRVNRQRVGQSPLEWAMQLASFFECPTLRDFVVHLFPNRRPQSPNKRLIIAKDWNFKASPDKEPPLVDDTLIRANQSAAIALFPVQVRVHVRKIGGKTHGHASVRFATCRARPSFTQSASRVRLLVVHAAGINTNFSSKRQEIGQNTSLWLRRPNRSRCAILVNVDHLTVLREKIGSLRDEIAHLQELNDQYRRAGRRGRNETDAQIAHGQRHERLEAIQQELAQIAGLGLRSVEQMKDQHRSRPYLLKKVS